MPPDTTMIITLGALLRLGGEVLFGFTAAMLLGIVIGTYSSIYVAAPLLIWLGAGPHSFLREEGKPGAERVAPRAPR